jgi:large repetitive protein
LPTAPGKEISRFPRGGTTKLKVVDLGASAPLKSLGVPTHGTVSNNLAYIFYVPFAGDNDNDSFTYTVTNSAGCAKTGTINVTVAVASGEAQEVTWADGKPTVKFAGIPGYRYDVERATDADFTRDLTTVLTTNVPSGGLFIFVDDNPSPLQGFYRLKYNP